MDNKFEVNGREYHYEFKRRTISGFSVYGDKFELYSKKLLWLENEPIEIIIKVCSYIISDLDEIFSGILLFENGYNLEIKSKDGVDFISDFTKYSVVDTGDYVIYRPDNYLEICDSEYWPLESLRHEKITYNLSDEMIINLVNYLIMPFDINRLKAAKSAR